MEETEMTALALGSGIENMELDAALLRAAERDGEIGWRVYGWDGPWISLGMNQDPMRDLLEPDLVPWVMRPTGGKAVLHGHDVTVGFAAPLSAIVGNGEPRTSRSVRAVYRWMTAPIVKALCACGLPAALAEDVNGIVKARLVGEAPSEPGAVVAGAGPRPRCIETIGSDGGSPTEKALVGQQPPKSPDCFKFVSPNDIVDSRTMAKCCGCALRITKSAALIQASIPAGKPLAAPTRVFENPAMIVSPAWDSERFAKAFAKAVQEFCSA